MTLILTKWLLNNISNIIMRILLRVTSPVLNLFLHITLLLMFLIWPASQYLIKITSIKGIWETNCLIPATDAELMVRHIHMREVYVPHHLRVFPKKNPHALHAKCVVVAPSGWTWTLCHLYRDD